jgi:hypothetical protein
MAVSVSEALTAAGNLSTTPHFILSGWRYRRWMSQSLPSLGAASPSASTESTHLFGRCSKLSNADDYDEELDRAIEYWQRSAEYEGGGRKELVRFFQQKTVDDYFEGVKAELEGRTIGGKSAAETRASMQEYMTRDVRSDKVYKARSQWARMMFKRLEYKEKEKESWRTIREYIKEPPKKEEEPEDPWKTIRDYLKEK